jgi:predicted dehydrogenase
MERIKIGIVGSSFGAEFIPLFRAHPNVRAVSVADLLPERRQYAQDLYGPMETFSTLDEMLKSDVDAVCIFTQRWMHAQQAIECLRAGKHVYSAVPAAITVEDMSALIETVKATGQMYMLGETSYYYPVAIYCRERFARGDFGHFVCAEATYMHDMAHGFYDAYMWANGDAWKRFASFPPMLYPTHTVSLVVTTTGERLTSVSCLGYRDRHDDGVFLRDVSAWQNEFSNETALFRTSGGGMARTGEFRRVGWSENANAAAVRLNLYGTRASFEEHGNGKVWNRVDSEEPEDVTDLLRVEQVEVSEEERENLPEGLVYNNHTGFARVHPRGRLPREFHGLNNGHEGSHLFLVDDFVRACVTMQLPINNVWQAARYNVPGIIAHLSAQRDGETLSIPDLGDPPA